MKNYLKNEDLTLIKKSSALIQLIYGSLIVKNASNFSGQSVIFSAFLSSITMNESTVANIIVNESTIEIISSSLQLNKMVFRNIVNSDKKNFIYLLESKLDAKNIYFKDSSSTLFTILDSSGTLVNINFANVNGGEELMHFDHCNSISLSKIELINTTTRSDSIIEFHMSKGVKIKDISLTNIFQIVFKIYQSEILSINSVNIEQSHESFKIIESKVSLLSDSNFTQNGKILK